MKMSSPAGLFAACAIVVVFSVATPAQQKRCSTASKFGPNDQIGNLNYLTPEKTIAASKLITKGKAYRSASRRIRTRPRSALAPSR